MINQFMNTLFKLIAQVGYLKQVAEYIDQFKYQLLDQQQTVSQLWGISTLAKKKKSANNRVLDEGNVQHFQFLRQMQSTLITYTKA